MKRQSIALTAYLISPLVVLVVLCWAIYFYLQQPKRMDVPPIGAGTAKASGANAIGEQIAHGTDKPQPQVYSGAGTQPGYDMPAAEKAGPQAKTTSQPPAATTPLTGMIEPESLPQGFMLIVEDKSGKANPASPIYLASNYGGWNPGDEKFKLDPQSDMRWRILVKRPEGKTDRIEFKFTRGSWDLEEINQDMSPPGNRSLPMIDAAEIKDGEIPKFEFTVPHWGDERPEFAAKASNDPYRPLKVTGDVRRLQVSSGSTAPGTMRDLFVWLPPGYNDAKNAQAKYPVLYLHDGQNIFEQHAGVPGEWGADETATALLVKHQISPVIIVAVPHSGKGRNSEYMPIAGIAEIPPRADIHLNWLITEVIPRVERAFRIKSGPENTAVGGSSLGAVISVYAATQHPDKFGMVLAESLPLRTGDGKLWDAFTGGINTWPRKVYLGMGGAETGAPSGKNADRNRAYVEAVQNLDKVLDKAGLGPDRRLLIIDADAEHTEKAWAKRLPQALTFLFPPPMDSTK